MHNVIDILIKLASTSTMTSKHACALMKGKKIIATGINYPVPCADIVNIAIRSKSFRRTGHCRETGEECGVQEVRRKKGTSFTTKYSPTRNNIIQSC